MRDSPHSPDFFSRSYSIPQRQWGKRVGKPPYAATSFISSKVSTSNTCGKKSSPLRRA